MKFFNHGKDEFDAKPADFEDEGAVTDAGAPVSTTVSRGPEGASNLGKIGSRSPERKLVIQGDFLGEGRGSYGTYEEREISNGMEMTRVYSRFVGLAENKNGFFMVIPLSGVYNPKKGDGVIGKIAEVDFSKWIVDRSEERRVGKECRS